MPVTLDQFKKAFASKVSDDQYKGRRGAAVAAIRETEEFVKVLGATDRAKELALSLAKLYVEIDNADKLAVKSRDKAYEALEKTKQSARTLCGQALVDAKKAFGEHKKKAESAFKTLENSPHAKKLSKEIEKAKGDLAVTQRLADANRFGEAIKLADEIAAESTTVRVKEELRKGEDPKKSDFEALAKMPGLKGKNRLDELVSELPEKTAAKAYKMAFEVRFGIKVDTYKNEKGKDDAVWDPVKKKYVKVGVAPPEWKRVSDKKPDKSLQKMYELFTKVPESHVNAAQNPSLKKIIHFTKDDDGAAYWSVTKNIYMNVSRGKGEGAKDQSNELATGRTGRNTDMFPDGRIDPYKPVNTKVKTPFFDWATLHEVGHSVDDKTNFMGTHSGTAYGDWVNESPDSVATVAAKKFGWDKAYIVAKLQNLKANPPVPKKLQDMKDSDKLKDKVDKWCEMVVSGEPWFNGGNAKAIQAAVDGRVYQQAYPNPNEWWSYGYGERQKGIHGYQFRSPAEWFAELYAAYYSEKLQDAHPFVADLKKLEKPS